MYLNLYIFNDINDYPILVQLEISIKLSYFSFPHAAHTMYVYTYDF